MTTLILSPITASISELKANPMQTIASAGGETVAILNRNKPAFYCVPAKAYEAMMDIFEDIQLGRIVRERENEPRIKVSWDDL
jgi:antitoxin StbD